MKIVPEEAENDKNIEKFLAAFCGKLGRIYSPACPSVKKQIKFQFLRC